MVDIEIKDLTKIFPPNVIALDNIDLHIKHNEFLVILGPSGSGKTTFLRVLAGLERPTKGYVAIGKQVVVDTEKKVFVPPQRRNIGMVFQNWALYPNMKVFDNIAFPLKIKKVPYSEIRKRVKELAEILNIEDTLDRYPRQISGGQQQRVALARALIKEPEVLLLDEPFSNLDARIRVTARTFVKRLQRRLGITAILVTHDQADAFAVADRVVVLRRGKIEQIGDPEELYEKPANTFIADFIGDPPINLVELPVIDGIIKPLNVKVEKCQCKSVIVGIRPDDARAFGKEGITTLKLRVETTMYIGSRQYAVVRLDNKTLRVLVEGQRRIEENEEIPVSVRRVHIFDPQNGKRILTISL